MAAVEPLEPASSSFTFTVKATVSLDAGVKVTMGITGHVSRAMLSRYSHVGKEAKRRDPTKSPHATMPRTKNAGMTPSNAGKR